MLREADSRDLQPRGSPSRTRAADAATIHSRDQFVEVRSTVPSIAGQTVKLYVRERVSAPMPERITGDKVVLFVHGAGTPGSVAFDVSYQDYSGMAFLAAAGHDASVVGLTGCGRSTRPPTMDDRARSSHRALWERNYRRIFGASLEWLEHGTATANLTARCDWITRAKS